MQRYVNGKWCDVIANGNTVQYIAVANVLGSSKAIIVTSCHLTIFAILANHSTMDCMHSVKDMYGQLLSLSVSSPS